MKVRGVELEHPLEQGVNSGYVRHRGGYRQAFGTT